MRDRMSADRVETVIEEMARVSRDWSTDGKGLAVIRLTLVRPSGDRVFIDYPAEEKDGA